MLKKIFDIKTITYSAIITAIMSISIPHKLQIVGPVPITLTVFVLSLFSMLFEPKYALTAVFTYWILLAIGLPVAVGYQGGISRFVSPWSGYLWMYPAFAIMEMFFSKYIKNSTTKTILAQSSALIILYIGGAVMLIISGKYNLPDSIRFGVKPFIIIDSLKIIAAFIIAKIIRKSTHIFKK